MNTLQDLLDKEGALRIQLQAIQKEITEFSDGFWYYVHIRGFEAVNEDNFCTNKVAADRLLVEIEHDNYMSLNDGDPIDFNGVVISNNPEFNYISSLDALELYIKKMYRIKIMDEYNLCSWRKDFTAVVNKLQAELDSLNDIEMVKFIKKFNY